MAKVVVVHGAGQEFGGSELMCQVVGPALRDGVRLAGGPGLASHDVACVFYGDLFLAQGSRSWDLPPWDEYDLTSDEAELLAAWWVRAAEVDAAVPAPDATASRGTGGFIASRALLPRRVRAAMDALSGSRYFARVAERVLVLAVKQMHRYLTEPALRSAVRLRITAGIGVDTRVLVAHSLGSVAAYEALCTNEDWSVTDFVTVGSPLGLRSLVFDRLEPAPVGGVGLWPGSVSRWTNVADPGDVVAFPGRLAERFGMRVLDRSITNGVRMHDLPRYLTPSRPGTRSPPVWWIGTAHDAPVCDHHWRRCLSGHWDPQPARRGGRRSPNA